MDTKTTQSRFECLTDDGTVLIVEADQYDAGIVNLSMAQRNKPILWLRMQHFDVYKLVDALKQAAMEAAHEG